MNVADFNNLKSEVEVFLEVSGKRISFCLPSCHNHFIQFNVINTVRLTMVMVTKQL